MLREKNTPGVIKPGVCYVRERIRTPDTLVRSQVLYPAELRTHIRRNAAFAEHLLQRLLFYLMMFVLSSSLYGKFYPF